MSKKIIDLLEKRQKTAIEEAGQRYVYFSFEETERILTFLKQQPTKSEFTKKVRESVQDRESVISKITDIRILAIIGWIPQLCGRLDSAEAENIELKAADKTHLSAFNGLQERYLQLEARNKDLLAACEGLMEKADNGSADFDDPVPGSIYLKAKVAIAKAKQ